jgi:hypothetical protein
MIDKRIQPSHTFRDMHSTAHLVGSFSKGLDKDILQKVASASSIIDMARDIKPEKGYGYVHLITTGAGDVYGPNNNADFFNKTASQVNIPNPKAGTSGTRTLAGGLKQFHNTFTKYASVYREHFNSKKGGTPLGEVVMEAYNEPMDRGELIVKLPESGWSGELQKLASDSGNVFFSMGAGVPFDICSICGNEAKLTSDYCDHIKYNRLQIDKEGNQAFLYNDQPHFHDISCVGTPADRIAFGLSKVASENEHVFAIDSDFNKGLYIPHSLIDKLAGRIIGDRSRTLEKLAEIEKQITLEPSSDDIKVLSDSFSDELDSETTKKLTDYPLEDVIGCCNKKDVMLPPKSFVKIVLGNPEGPIDGLEDMEEALPNVFQKLKADGAEALQDGSYTSGDSSRHWSGLDELIGNLTGDHSLADEPTNARVVKTIVVGQPKEKVASERPTTAPSPSGEYLAKEYAKYQLSFLNGRDKYAKLVAVHNAHSLYN